MSPRSNFPTDEWWDELVARTEFVRRPCAGISIDGATRAPQPCRRGVYTQGLGIPECKRLGKGSQVSTVDTSLSKPGYVYVASSWRCPMQGAVVAALRSAGIAHYDFKNPPDGVGFGWGEVMPSFDIARQEVRVEDYLTGLQHPRAIEGFDSDFAAMEKADTFVLVLPCGRSAHLELGWAVGQGKRTAILLDSAYGADTVTPELMYRMVDYLAPTLFDLLGWLGVED